jgi:SAM-dependent methyltransferase
VTAFDGRNENVEEAQIRVPNVDFHLADAEDPSLPKLGSFDLVLCIGLLYHLENPFRAIRNLYGLTGKVLVVESMCVPEDSPQLYMIGEANVETQGLNYISFYPSEGCLIKMLYQAGFPLVYRFDTFPNHDDFRASAGRKRARTMLVASQLKLELPALLLAKEPENPPDLWSTAGLGPSGVRDRAILFLRRSWPEKLLAIRRLLNRKASPARGI